MPALIIHCSCPDRQVADTLARALVEERLAACVQSVPGVRSTYRWQGRLEQTDEVLLLIKTTRDRLDAIVARITQLHPYENAEVLAVEAVGGSAPYLQWLSAGTRSDA